MKKKQCILNVMYYSVSQPSLILAGCRSSMLNIVSMKIIVKWPNGWLAQPGSGSLNGNAMWRSLRKHEMALIYSTYVDIIVIVMTILCYSADDLMMQYSIDDDDIRWKSVVPGTLLLPMTWKFWKADLKSILHCCSFLIGVGGGGQYYIDWKGYHSILMTIIRDYSVHCWAIRLSIFYLLV